MDRCPLCGYNPNAGPLPLVEGCAASVAGDVMTQDVAFEFSPPLPVVETGTKDSP